MRHIHADVIHAWAEGAEVEYWSEHINDWREANAPAFDPDIKYRIKPKEPEWYERIPEHGVLVKSNHDCSIAVLVAEDIKAINTDPLDWTPLTNEEIERFKQ